MRKLSIIVPIHLINHTSRRSRDQT